jgi:hypothetical protein
MMSCELCKVVMPSESFTDVRGHLLCPYCTVVMWGKPQEAFDEVFRPDREELGDGRFEDNAGLVPVGRTDGRPPNIVVEHVKVNDIISANGFIKDVLGVASHHPRVNRANRAVMESMIEEMNNINEELVARQKVGEKAAYSAPIIFDKGKSDFFYKVYDMAESLYGKFVKEWFLTKKREDWVAWRRILYTRAWEIGSMHRYGTPSRCESPWLSGKKAPIDDDPFGTQPIGKEERPVY